MVSLNKFIFKKQYFTLKYREIFMSHNVLLFLKYDGNSTNNVNLLRTFCIKNDISVNLINSKYIDMFLFKNLNINYINWIKSDIIIVSFSTLSAFFSCFDKEVFKNFLNHLNILGISINNYLVNFSENKLLFESDNKVIYSTLYNNLVGMLIMLVSLFYFLLYNFIIIFELLFLYIKKNKE